MLGSQWLCRRRWRQELWDWQMSLGIHADYSFIRFSNIFTRCTFSKLFTLEKSNLITLVTQLVILSKPDVMLFVSLPFSVHIISDSNTRLL